MLTTLLLMWMDPHISQLTSFNQWSDSAAMVLGAELLGAGDKTCAGTTAAAFGRTVNDRSSLYLTTNGGMSYPVDGEVGSARLLKIKVGHAGA